VGTTQLVYLLFCGVREWRVELHGAAEVAIKQALHIAEKGRAAVVVGNAAVYTQSDHIWLVREPSRSNQHQQSVTGMVLIPSDGKSHVSDRTLHGHIIVRCNAARGCPLAHA
jgi:hypothetical protein